MNESDKDCLRQLVAEDGFDRVFSYSNSHENVRDKKFHKLLDDYVNASYALKQYLNIED